MKRSFVFLGAALLILAFASIASMPVAHAHAEPEECTPPIDGTVETAPEKVVCTTTQAMDPKQSKLEVFDASGTQVDTGHSAVDLNNPDRNTISVSLNPAKMKDGVYTVKWETFSTEDNEDASGEFKFTVKSGVAAQPTATATTAAEPTATPTTAPETTTAPTAEPTPTTPTTTLPATGAAMSNLGFVLIAFLGLLLLGFGLFARARR